MKQRRGGKKIGQWKEERNIHFALLAQFLFREFQSEN